MAGKAKPLTVTLFIRLEDGNTVEWDSLTEEKKEYCRNKMCENLSRRMSEYYAAHPDEYERLESL